MAPSKPRSRRPTTTARTARPERTSPRGAARRAKAAPAKEQAQAREPDDDDDVQVKAAPATVPEIDVERTPAPTSPELKPLKGDTDDHLSTYFRDLAEHDLLGPEQERELAQGIEDQEILTWERIFARPDVVLQVVQMLDGKLENPLKPQKLVKCAEVALASGKKPDPKALQKMAKEAREVSEQLRAQDLDRTHVDVVIRELRRERTEALKGAPSELGAGTRAFQQYLGGIDDAYRGASALREEFVKANLRLVVTMARRYDRGGMPLADLIQEGNLGLMHAVGRFDYRRGLRFSTYACWWIRHAIGRALADKARAVRIPVHMLEAQQQLEKVRQQLIRELGRQPTPQEVAKAARVPLAKLNQMHRYLMGQPLSLDRPIHENDDRQLGETLADPDTEDTDPAGDITTLALTKQVRSLMHALSPIEADVLRQRFGLLNDEERTFREIGDQYRLSRERIRQIQNSALDKLKKALERDHVGLFEN